MVSEVSDLSDKNDRGEIIQKRSSPENTNFTPTMDCATPTERLDAVIQRAQIFEHGTRKSGLDKRVVRANVCPPTKKSVTEVLSEIQQGKENAEAFGRRCRPTDEDMQIRVTI